MNIEKSLTWVCDRVFLPHNRFKAGVCMLWQSLKVVTNPSSPPPSRKTKRPSYVWQRLDVGISALESYTGLSLTDISCERALEKKRGELNWWWWSLSWGATDKYNKTALAPFQSLVIADQHAAVNMYNEDFKWLTNNIAWSESILWR